MDIKQLTQYTNKGKGAVGSEKSSFPLTLQTDSTLRKSD